jgi:two-component sensor histidine kinase
VPKSGFRPAPAPAEPDAEAVRHPSLTAVIRMLALSQRLRATPWQVAALAVILWAAGLAARFLADPYLPPGFPYVTFFPLVVLAGLLGGTACGVLCATLSGLSAWYFFIPPFHSFEINAAKLVALAFYAFVVAANLALIQFLFWALELTSRERSRLSASLKHQRALFAELQHRVANNLAFISALFGLQKRRLAHDAAAVAAFEDARMRLDTMGRLHRQLYDPANADLPFETVLRDLLGGMLQGAGRSDVTLSFDIAPIALPMQKVMTLSLFALEAGTNALKHAFADAKPGVLRVSLRPLDGERARFTIADDGPGWPSGGPPLGGRSLGLRILKSFAATLRGALSFETQDGAATHLDFPLAAAPDAQEAPPAQQEAPPA